MMLRRPARVSSVVLLAALGACPSRPRTPAPTAAPAASTEIAIVQPDFRRAVDRGTRTLTGQPGPKYWQQYARYDLAAELDPKAARLTGHGSVRYLNRSPDTLRAVAVHLYQNLFTPSPDKSRPALPNTGGITLTAVRAQGSELAAGDSARPGYRVDGTVAWLRLPRALAPGDSADFEFAWTFKVPQAEVPRMGQDGEVFFLGYWYPQLAVYDDVVGWQTDQYRGNGEFYMGYADYRYAVTLPHGWLVAGTGTLENPTEVLSAQTRQRLLTARSANRVIPIVRDDDRVAGTSTTRSPSGKLTWRFAATNVRDVAWGASNLYVWDAWHAVVGRADTVMVHGLYRRKVAAWIESARHVKQSVEFLSDYLWPYPYPQMTAVEGLIGGGMEYPMLTLIGGVEDPTALLAVTLHETGHMWFPMQVGSDEKRYAWMDEGLTQYDENQGLAKFLNGLYDPEREAQRSYVTQVVRARQDAPLMRAADDFPYQDATYQLAAYDKPAVVLRALRGVLGDSVFHRAFREYGRRWTGKHPRPEDFFATIEDASGQRLGWFWRSWFFTTDQLDQAVAAVVPQGDSVSIVIEDKGRVPMPILLAITRADGNVQRLTVPVDVWLGGARSHAVRVVGNPVLTKVEIDPKSMFPDVNRENGVWRR